MNEGDVPASNVAIESEAADQTLLIAGILVRFPVGLEPHKPQRTIMHHVIRSLQRTQNALIESPTGTGKSLALLCSSLAWLESEREQARGGGAAPYVQHETASVQSKHEKQTIIQDQRPPEFPVDDDDDDDFTSRPTPRCQKTIASSFGSLPTALRQGNENVSLAKSGIIQDPASSVAFAQTRGSTATSATHPRIFFCSRTHAQLSQVVAEMRRTPYAATMRSTLLASREHYCIHPEVQALPKSLQTDACQRAIQQSIGEGKTAVTRVMPAAAADPLAAVSACYRHLYGAVRRTACMAPQPFQIEDIVRVARRWQGCPYFAARFLVEGDLGLNSGPDVSDSSKLAKSERLTCNNASSSGSATQASEHTAQSRAGVEPADIIFCPYSYLVDPVVRKRMGIDVTGAVVILDEAHNIEEACLEAASVDLIRSQVQRVCHRVDHYLRSDQPDPCFSPEKVVSVRTYLTGDQLLRVWQHWLHTLVSWIEKLVSHLDQENLTEEPTRSALTRRTGMQRLGGQATIFWQDGAMLHELETGLLGTRDFTHWERSFEQLRRYVDRLRIKGQRKAPALGVGRLLNSETEDSDQTPVSEHDQESQASFASKAEDDEPLTFRHCLEVLHLLERLHVVLRFIYRGQDEDRKESLPDTAFLHAADYRLVLRRESCYEPNRSVEFRLGLWCMSPAIAFGYLRTKARSIVLTSGTLSPMDSFRSELATHFAYQAECDHIVNAEQQVQTCVVASSSSGVNLEGSYRHSATWAYQDAIGEALQRCCAQVPDGVLCFLPSYRMLESMLQRWMSTGALERIRGDKRLFVEQATGKGLLELSNTGPEQPYSATSTTTKPYSRVLVAQNRSSGVLHISGFLPAADAQQNRSIGRQPRRKRPKAGRRKEDSDLLASKDILRVLYQAVDTARQEREFPMVPGATTETQVTRTTRNTGVILLAVCRGKVSEGLNFADHYGRAVCMIGIPYPNVTDAFVQLKMRYNDERLGNQGASQSTRLTGKQWYALQAYRTVNQALGRCIRNPKDYASIILLDVRYRELSTMNRLSRWLRDPLRKYVAQHGPQLVLEDAEDALCTFFASKIESSPTAPASKWERAAHSSSSRP
jgi:Fanconi anemia group J protein